MLKIFFFTAVFYTSLAFSMEETLTQNNSRPPSFKIQSVVKDDILVGCNTRRESDWMSILGSCHQLEKNTLNLKETLPRAPLEKESFFSSLYQLFITSFKEPPENIIKKFLREDNPGYTYAPVFSKGTLWLDGVPGGKGDAIISVLYEAWQNIKEDSIMPILLPSKIYGSSFNAFYQALQKADLTILLVDDTATELKAFKKSLRPLPLKVIFLLYKGK